MQMRIDSPYPTSKLIKRPTIKAVFCRTGFRHRSKRTRIRSGEFGAIFLFQSKLIFCLHLGRFQKTSDLHRAISLGGCRIADGLFAFLGVEFGVIAGEFLQRDQEITEVSLEFVQVVGVGEKPNDELLDLDTGKS